jgi:putative ABC transport system substrate-binding protein
LNRREHLIVGGSVVAWPLAARAQQQVMPVIGYLSGAGQPNQTTLAAFWQGVNEVGFVEGRNVIVEVRATDRYDQLLAFAAELVRRQVDVIYAFGTANSAQAAKAATATIPIVFANGSDPVSLGLVASISRPAGNVTGVTFFTSTLVSVSSSRAQSQPICRCCSRANSSWSSI